MAPDTSSPPVDEQRRVHDQQGSLPELERSTGDHVEDRELATGPGTEPLRFGVAEGRVVLEPGRLVVAPRVRVSEPQVVLADAPRRLLEAGHPAGAPERLELVGDPVGGPVAAIAAVQADLVAAVVDLGEEPDDERIVAPVAVVVVAGLVAGEDVERAAQAVPLARRHQRVEGVERVPVHPAGSRVGRAADAPPGQARVTPPDDVAGCRSGDRPRGFADRRPRVVDVVRRPEAERARTTLERRPQLVQRGPQEVDVLVHDRAPEEPFLDGDRRGRREPIVLVALRPRRPPRSG